MKSRIGAVVLLTLAGFLVGCESPLNLRLPSTSKEITSFTVESLGAVGVIDETNKTITLEVPPSTDLSEPLIASFKTTGKTVKVGSTKQISSQTPNNFETPLTYQVIAEDASTCTYEVLASYKMNSIKQITSFIIAEPRTIGLIDEENQVITATIPYGISRTKLSTIIVYEGASLDPATGSEQDFSAPVVYTVTAEDGTTQSYTASVILENPDSNANLSAILLSSGSLTPTFDPSITSYTVAVHNSIDNVTVTGIAADDTASVSGPVRVDSLIAGEAKTASICVTPQEGIAKTYTVSITRNQPASAGSLTLGASRLSGVAPLSVLFTAEYPDDDESSRWFHEYEYSWEFGDYQSGNWETSGLPKNNERGPIAAHIFETPGQYLVMLSVKDSGNIISTSTVTITVSDPSVVYAGSKTICVSNTTDFTGAPAGAQLITTANLSTITKYAVAGRRILLRRGSTWETSSLAWPTNAGPVTIGAFGSGNKPIISITGGSFLSLDDKQDWRIMDLDLRDQTKSFGTFGGVSNMQRILLLRISTRGFADGIGWSHWNDSRLLTIDQMSIVDCDLSDTKENIAYVGSERLVLMGNRFQNAETSHVLRVWQAYKSVISHNILSGSSIGNSNGRHVLKLHGPMESELGPAVYTLKLAHRTSRVVISDNVFGSSGPWPINIAPQDSGSDERISHVLFERNRYFATFGTLSSTPLQIALRIAARYVTIRNNILDGSGSGEYFTGIEVVNDGQEPVPLGVAIYNNTIYKSGNNAEEKWVGISITSAAINTTAINNLVSFPNASGTSAVRNSSSTSSLASNLLAPLASYIDPRASSPLLRDFRLNPGSAGIDAGTAAPVFEDLKQMPRPQGAAMDIGAHEQ